LAEVSRGLALGSYVRLSRAEIASGGANRDSTLADVFESLMGAIYKESGFETALKVVQRVFEERVQSVHPNDPKTELQESLHQLGAEPPEYLLELVEGPEHAPTFVSLVKVSGEPIGKGTGRTKKASQQGAAAEALKNLIQDLSLRERILNKTSVTTPEILNINSASAKEETV
jgi:ribonuclease-3